MSTYRLDLSIQETIDVTSPGQEPSTMLGEQRSLVLVYTDDETVMAAALRAAAEMLDPKDPVNIRKRAVRPESAAGIRRRGAAGREEDEEFV